MIIYFAFSDEASQSLSIAKFYLCKSKILDSQAKPFFFGLINLLLKEWPFLCMKESFCACYNITPLGARCHHMSTFGIDTPHSSSPPPSYLFSIPTVISSSHLARPLPARHPIFGITAFCRAASQWHQLSPLPFQHPPLSAAQSWSIYPPSHWSFSQTTPAKGRRGCRDVIQPAASQTPLRPFSGL